MNIALAIKNWKFIVMAALAIALAFSVTSCTSKSHQIDLLESQKTFTETQRDLARSESAAASLETEKVWAHQLLESEQNANKNLQVALAAASDSALAVDRLSKQISDTNKRLSTAPHQTIIEYTTTNSELLEACTAEYRSLAEKADGHSVDAMRLYDSWPVK